MTLSGTHTYSHTGKDSTGATVSTLSALTATYASNALTGLTSGHNQIFTIVCNDVKAGSDTILSVSSTTPPTTIDGSSVNTVCVFNDPQRAVVGTDTAKIGITTSSNSAMISGQYSTTITAAVTDNS